MTAESGLGRFRDLLARRLGWSFADSDAGQLDRLLDERARKHGLGRGDYLNRLAGRPWPAELTELVERLSITETYFFRHGEQFRALREHALPERVEARRVPRVLRMLSVACSSGEEAYSLAITARQVCTEPDWLIEVTGVDANPAMLRRAEAGWYSAWSLRETPDPLRRRWFRPDEAGYRVTDEVRRLVRFRRHNVAEPDDGLWQPGRYDVIFCRNLLMYLNPDVAQGLVERITEALVPGGYVFLGHTDSLGSAPEGLELRHSHHVFYYRRCGGPAPAPRSAPAPAASSPQPDPGRPAPPAGEDARNRALALLRDERFGDALDALGRPAPDDELLRGVLLSLAGRCDEATATARRLIAANGLHADAHQLLGLCLEAAGADHEAAAQYRMTVYLDPTFALARLRLGQLARRHGDERTAAAELARALDLLPAEDEERITLFGGGFGRLSLAMLCRSELDSCGARR